MTYIIISLIILLISFGVLFSAYHIKTQRIEQINRVNTQIACQQNALKQTQNELLSLQNQKKQVLTEITQNKNNLDSLYKEQDRLNGELKQKEKNITSYYKILKDQAQQGFNYYELGLDKYYQEKEKEFNSKINRINIETRQAQEKLDQIKNIIKAATAARLREQEKENEWAFYRIQLSDQQATDISNLQLWKNKLYDPSIVAKIIWSSYIMKPTTDMCNRVLGTNKPVCGIYKITNKTTGKVYIGQSVDIASRWKQHVKCGLGIDTPSTNKLYNNMQNTGVWLFTFEVLQTCSRDRLNEKERYWIDMYESNKVGMNVTKGNK